MTIERLIPVTDGVICLIHGDFSVPKLLNDQDVDINVVDSGVKLSINGRAFEFPGILLELLENADVSNLYFYGVLLYELVPEYRGCVTLQRDAVLKVKSVWDYLSRSP